MLKLFTNHKAGLAVTARTLGLSHDGGHGLSGEHDGIPVGVRLWSQSNGDNTSYYTTVHAGHPVPLRMGLTASRVGALARFVRYAMGGEDIATGHPELDTHFLVRASDRPAQADPAWDSAGPVPHSSDAPFRIFNIGNGRPMAITRYVEAVEAALGLKAELRLLPIQPGDMRETYADVSELEKWVGYRPVIEIDEGVRRFVAWYKDYFAT